MGGLIGWGQVEAGFCNWGHGMCTHRSAAGGPPPIRPTTPPWPAHPGSLAQRLKREAYAAMRGAYLAGKRRGAAGACALEPKGCVRLLPGRTFTEPPHNPRPGDGWVWNGSGRWDVPDWKEGCCGFRRVSRGWVGGSSPSLRVGGFWLAKKGPIPSLGSECLCQMPSGPPRAQLSSGGP